MSTITADSGEQYVLDTNHPSGWHDATAWVSTTDPNYRVIIERQDSTGNDPFDWDTWLSCYAGRDYAGKPRRHRSLHLWNASRNHSLPDQQVVLGTYTTVHDLDDDELDEYLPADGTIIGLDYYGGDSLSVSDSTDPREWDGYFHITEAHWLALMGPSSREGWTYTSREAHLRRGLAADCANVTAWINGEVYGWALERRDTWTNDRTGTQRDEWETVESCGGYYAVERSWLDDLVIEAFSCRPREAQEVAA